VDGFLSGRRRGEREKKEKRKEEERKEKGGGKFKRSIAIRSSK
jgi:hypothetical protein